MGKRGPQPKGGYAQKSGVLSTRITPELREELTKAAAESGRSLSSEIEHRLRRSFRQQERMRDLFGSLEISALMRMVADVINVTAQQAGSYARDTRGDSEINLLNDPYVYNQAVGAVMLVLEVFRPPGDRSRPRRPDESTAEAQLHTHLGEGVTWGSGYAKFLLSKVRNAQGDFPLPKDGENPWLLHVRELADDLGDTKRRLDDNFKEDPAISITIEGALPKQSDADSTESRNSEDAETPANSPKTPAAERKRDKKGTTQ